MASPSCDDQDIPRQLVHESLWILSDKREAERKALNLVSDAADRVTTLTGQISEKVSEVQNASITIVRGSWSPTIRVGVFVTVIRVDEAVIWVWFVGNNNLTDEEIIGVANKAIESLATARKAP